MYKTYICVYTSWTRDTWLPVRI